MMIPLTKSLSGSMDGNFNTSGHLEEVSKCVKDGLAEVRKNSHDRLTF